MDCVGVSRTVGIYQFMVVLLLFVLFSDRYLLERPPLRLTFYFHVNLKPIRIVLFSIHIQFGGFLYRGVKDEIGSETPIFRIKIHLDWVALPGMDIRPRQRPHFQKLRTPIRFEHSFCRACVSGMVTETLIHPVIPRAERIVKGITRVIQLNSAAFSVEAGAELCPDQGHFVELGRLQASRDFVRVERAAQLFVL